MRGRADISLSYLARWLRQGRGASAVEYLVALILSALVVLGVVKLFGSTIYEKYQMGDARISDMERDQRSLGAGGSSDGTLISASEADPSGSASSGSKTYQIKNNATSLKGFSSGDSQLSQEEQKRLMAKRRVASLASSEGGSSEQKKSGSSGSEGELEDPEMRRQRYALRGETPPEEFKFNPFILIIIALLLLGLGYMMVKGNKDEG